MNLSIREISDVQRKSKKSKGFKNKKEICKRYVIIL